MSLTKLTLAGNYWDGKIANLCGSGSGFARIRIHFGRLDPDPGPHWEYGSGSGSRRAIMNHKSEENSSFEVLDVLFRGMKTSPVAWTSFMGFLGISKLQFLIKKI
jgi:hypothetical protein